MRTRTFRCAFVGLLAIGLTAVGMPPAGAEPIDVPATKMADGRFERLDTSRVGKIINGPQSADKSKTVSALVQLSGDPVVVEEAKNTPGFSRRAAERRVKASQDAAVPRLKAAGAQTYGRLDTVLNAVQVRVKVADLAKVAAVPGVRAVQVSHTVSLDNAASNRFTGVDRTWQNLKLTGKGQVIGIIDTGIDYTHADFGGAGTAAAYKANNGTVIEPGSFPTAKVTGGYDFVGDAYDAGSAVAANTVPKPDADPLDCEGHGTHVAGTAAGSGVTAAGATYPGPYNRATLNQGWDVEPGAAPQATLKAYRVFGCTGTVSDDIVVAAIDRAVSDGVDVINMSLGSTFGTADNLDNVAIETATEAGTLVVTSAGNEGSGAYTVGAPSTSDAALSVAAVDAEMAQLPGVTIAGAVSAEGLNANMAPIPSAITGSLVDVGLGCAAADYAGVSGKIALSTRGVCARVDRATLGQAAGARAVIMINTDVALPPLEGPIPAVTIPFIGVSSTTSAAFLAATGKQITITANAGITNPSYRQVADFSSNGPRRLDSAQKPDVAAPGVSVPSAAVGTGTGYVRESGTSMASPHTAGVAALVGQAHPTWSPERIKALIMSTAAPAKVADYDSRRAGTGLVQPLRAASTKTYAWTSSGLNSLKFGMNQLGGRYQETQSFKVTNKSSHTVTYDLSTQLSSKRYGAGITISPRTVKVRAGKTAKVAVTIRLSRSAVAKLPGASASDGGALTSLNGLVLATPRVKRADVSPLRMTFLLVPVPLSDITAQRSVQTTAGRASIGVRNNGVHTGTADLYSWLLADPAGDATDPDVADLTNVGVQSLPGELVGAPTSDRLLVFAASMATGTSTQSTHEVDVLIDTDGDGTPDFVTFAADNGLVFAGTPDGTMASVTVDLATGALVDAWSATAPANGSTIEMPVLASSLGLKSGAGKISVSAAGFSTVSAAAGDPATGSATFDAYSPALSQGNLVTVKPGKSTTIPVTVASSALVGQSHPGWLVVSTDDRAGFAETDRVKLLVPSSSTALVTRPTR